MRENADARFSGSSKACPSSRCAECVRDTEGGRATMFEATARLKVRDGEL
jgi:hypothetical protein